MNKAHLLDLFDQLKRQMWSVSGDIPHEIEMILETMQEILKVLAELD